MTSPWTSRSGTQIRDLVPAALRREWVRAGHCPGRDVHALFRERVAAHPNREAVIDSDRVLTYAELDHEVQRIAAALAADGVDRQDVVGIRLPNGWRAVVAELAVAALGAVALPYPAGRGHRDTTALLGRSGAGAAIFASTEDAEFAAQSPDLPHLRVVRTFGSGADDALDSAPQAECAPVPVHPEAPVRILVTSGSEAAPKMIAYSHNAMAGGRANYVRALGDGADPVRGLIMMPMSSSYGSLAFVSIAALGSTLILMDRFDEATALRLITQCRPTHVFGVPTMLRRLAQHPGFPEEDTGSLRVVVSSSAPLSDVTAQACEQRLGARVISVYGSSDGVNCHTARTGRAGGAGLPDPAVADIHVADSQGRRLPPGETGEICALGPMTPLSYVGSPELDARYRTREGWVRSGDQGVLDEQGRLHVLGRLKQVVVRGGRNISPAEVELEISAHPSVVDVACVAVPDPDLGEKLCACVSLAAGAPGLELPELTAFLEQRGLERHKLPELLVALEELPLAPTGKVCRRTVSAIAAERAGAR